MPGTMVRIISTIVNWHLKGEIQLVSYCQIVILVFPIAGDGYNLNPQMEIFPNSQGCFWLVVFKER